MNLNKVVLLVLGFLLCTYCLNAQENIDCPSSDFGILDSSPITLACNKLNISLTGRARPGIQSYQWTTKEGLIISDGNALFPIIGRGGMYYLEVVGTNGCTGIDSVLVISDPLKPSVDIETTASTLTSINSFLPSFLITEY